MQKVKIIYDVSKSLNDLEETVNAELANGWTLLNGFSAPHGIAFVLVKETS